MIPAPSAGLFPAAPVCPVPPLGCALARSVAGSVAGSAARSASRAVARSVFAAFTAWLSAGAGWLVPHAVSLAVRGPGTAHAGGIRLTGAWFRSSRRNVLSLSVLVLLVMLCGATLGAVIRQDLRRLLRTWAVYLPVSILGSAAAIVLTDKALQVCNAMCAAVSVGTGRAGYSAFGRLMRAALVPAVPQFVAVVVSVLLILGAMFLWLELVLRGAAVYLAVFLLPLALAGLVWPATAIAAKRMVEILTALVFSKFVIVAALTLGLGAMSSAHGIDATLTGSAIILLAAFAPFAVLRLVPLVEVAAIGHLEGMSRRPYQAARRVATSMAYAPNHPLTAMLRQAGGQSRDGEEAGAVSGVTARLIAEHLGDWPSPPTAAHSAAGASLPAPEASVSGQGPPGESHRGSGGARNGEEA